MTGSYPKDFSPASIQIIWRFEDHDGIWQEAIKESKKDNNLIIFNVLKKIPSLLQHYIQNFKETLIPQIIGLFLSLLIEKIYSEKIY